MNTTTNQAATLRDARYLLKHCRLILERHGSTSLIVEVDDFLAATERAAIQPAGDEIAESHERLSKHCVAITDKGAPMSLVERIDELYSWYAAIVNDTDTPTAPVQHDASELPPLPKSDNSYMYRDDVMVVPLDDVLIYGQACATATLAAREAKAAPSRAVRIAQKQKVDPKLAGPGVNATERFLYAQLGQLQAAVLAPVSETKAAPGVPDGWLLMPKQMTDAMRDAANVIVLDRGKLVQIYKALQGVVSPPPATVSNPTVTCQIYGHVVSPCAECNLGADADINETNKVLADNYRRLTLGSNPAGMEGENSHG